MQNTNYIWFSQTLRENIIGKASSWDLIHANASSVFVTGLDQWCSGHTKNPHPRGCSQLLQKLPPALAGQTEPSPSSWEVWSPSTSYSRAGKAQSLEKQKRFICGWSYLLTFPLRKRLWFCYHTLMLPGREKRGALGSKVSQISMLNTQSSVPVYPQLDPLLCSWHTVKILGWTVVQPWASQGKSMSPRRQGPCSKG